MSPAVLKGLVQTLITVFQFFLNNKLGEATYHYWPHSALICTSRGVFVVEKLSWGGQRFFSLHTCTHTHSVGTPPATHPAPPQSPVPPIPSLNPICSVSLSSAGTKLKACSHKNTSHFQGIGCPARLETSFILANFSIIFPVVETCKKYKNQ